MGRCRHGETGRDDMVVNGLPQFKLSCAITLDRTRVFTSESLLLPPSSSIVRLPVPRRHSKAGLLEENSCRIHCRLDPFLPSICPACPVSSHGLIVTLSWLLARLRLAWLSLAWLGFAPTRQSKKRDIDQLPVFRFQPRLLAYF